MAHGEKLKDIIVSVWQGKTILLDSLIRHLSHESLMLWERSHKTILWDIFSFCELVWFLDEISQESSLLEKMHMGWPGDGLCYCANKDQSREIFKQVDSETVCGPWSKEASKRINILLCWAQDGQLFLHFDSNNFKFFDLYICLKWVVT